MPPMLYANKFSVLSQISYVGSVDRYCIFSLCPLFSCRWILADKLVLVHFQLLTVLCQNYMTLPGLLLVVYHGVMFEVMGMSDP